MKKIKKIIEVKRGDPAPSNARWLKDFSKVVGTKQEYCDDGQGSWYEDVPVHATFDVFEVVEILPMSDFYTKKASEIFGVKYEDVTPEQRAHAKGVSFLGMYSPKGKQND